MGVLDTKHGFLVTLQRLDLGDGAYGYAGTVAEHDVTHAVQFLVAADGTVALDVASPCPAELGERARLVVRASLKQNAGLDLPPPRRITRWRPAK